MERIGKWEFEREGGNRLVYRLNAGTTVIGWVIGLVVIFFLICGAYASFVNKDVGWVIGLGIAGILVLVLLVKNQMLCSVGCVLEGRLDQFRTDSSVLCTLSEIERVSCEWHKTAGRGSEMSTRGAYMVYFVLRSGKKIYTYLGEQGQSASEAQAGILSQFLAQARPERAVSRAVGI